MTKAAPQRSLNQLELVRNLLDFEGSAGVDCATAAGQVLDKVRRQFVPLLGAASFQALFSRTVRGVAKEYSWIALSDASNGSAGLRSCLHKQKPAVARQGAEALLATLLTLIATFVGERVTSQILRSAWPTILNDPEPVETPK